MGAIRYYCTGCQQWITEQTTDEGDHHSDWQGLCDPCFRRERAFHFEWEDKQRRESEENPVDVSGRDEIPF